MVIYSGGGSLSSAFAAFWLLGADLAIPYLKMHCVWPKVPPQSDLLGAGEIAWTKKISGGGRIHLLRNQLSAESLPGNETVLFPVVDMTQIC